MNYVSGNVVLRQNLVSSNELNHPNIVPHRRFLIFQNRHVKKGPHCHQPIELNSVVKVTYE